jgi:hypothetical protein
MPRWRSVSWFSVMGPIVRLFAPWVKHLFVEQVFALVCKGSEKI